MGARETSRQFRASSSRAFVSATLGMASAPPTLLALGPAGYMLVQGEDIPGAVISLVKLC